MNRLGVFTLAVTGLLAPLAASALAQTPPDAPPAQAQTQQGNTFSDPAMSFTPPAEFRRIGVPPHDPATFDNKTVVAAYVKNPNTRDAMTLTVTMENFSGSAAGYSTSSDNDLRGSTDGVFIKQTNTTLSNGMPAVFEQVTIGSGFAQMEAYRYLWADGVRGVTVQETARYGSLDAKHAMADMASLSAVAYPKNRY